MVTFVAGQLPVDNSGLAGVSFFSDIGKSGVTFQLNAHAGVLQDSSQKLSFTGDFAPADVVGTVHSVTYVAGPYQFFKMSGLSISLTEFILAGTSNDFQRLSQDIFKGNDHIVGSSNFISDFLYGFSGNDLIEGRAGGDFLYGDRGNDTLNGGRGFDILTGGPGHDKFVFNCALGPANVDAIVDFAHGIDKIELSHRAFGKLLAGPLAAKFFHVGAAAHDVNDFIVYDHKQGDLYYDPDGRGPQGQILVAEVISGNTHATLSASDFLVI